MVEVAVGMLLVVVEEVGVTSVGKMVILQGNVAKFLNWMWNMGITVVLRLSMLPIQMVLLSKEDPMMVEAITMVVVVADMDVEVGDIVVRKVVTVVASRMEMMVDMETVV
ncbi:hypothetical protein H5410_001718 [Solanum commersonii]|uniref:Uncharacterized protein n=1 Tax=Solanum commersonii TaxID=4109 RepID=A0A9J6AZY4_SOLCO|nr:hypothetical protein H5410_001718 [Solanum commersonii]